MVERYATMPFDEAIAFLRQKISLPTDRWDDISGDEHSAAFVVAGAKGTLLADIRAAVERAIVEGKRPEEFRQTFDRIAQGWIADKELRDWRAGIIYSTNLRQSYRAGRAQYQLDPETLKLQPYLRYIHGDSRAPRPHHLALDGLVFRAEEIPWYPPIGYGCSCRAISLTQRQFERLGLELSSLKLGDLAPYEDERGQVRQALLNPDKGFDPKPPTDPGKNRDAIIQRIIDRIPEPLKGQMEAEVAKINAKFAKPVVRKPAGTPVSNALTLPKKGAKTLRDTLAAIDALHGDGSLPVIPVKQTSKGYGGSFWYVLGDPGFPIRIDLKSLEEGLTFVHEIGHFLDFSGIGSGRHATEAGDPRLEAWRTEVENSTLIQKLRRSLDDGFIEIGGVTLVLKDRQRKYIRDYLLLPREIWARTYSQWVAQKVGGSMKAELDASHPLFQWEESDFEGISRAIDDLFVELGWLR